MGAHFEREVLPGVAKPAYAIAWGDLDGNGSLDLVTGSYDAALLTDLGSRAARPWEGGGAARQWRPVRRRVAAFSRLRKSSSAVRRVM